MTTNWLAVILVTLGFVMIIVGVVVIFWPAALIIGGALAMGVGLFGVDYT